MGRASTFTSYINVEPDKAIDAKFAALERRASSTFSRIAAQAAKANASVAAGMASPLRGGAIGGPTTGNLQAQARAQRELARENQRTAAAAARTNRELDRTGTASARARREVSSLERSLRTTATTLNVVQGPLGPLSGRISAMAAAVSELTGLRLGLAGVAAGLFGFVSQANKYTEVRSKLVPLYESQMDVNRAMRETVRIANEARTSLSPVVDLYARLTIGGREAGLAPSAISKVTEVAAKAAKLSGGTMVSQEAGLYQFAQGLGSGNLGGDELKSVRENTLRLAKAIADGMGVAVSDLKKLGAEGKLTAKVLADALEKEGERIDKELERLPETISSATAKLSTAFNVMIGESDQQRGFTNALAESIAFLARNLDIATEAAIALGLTFVNLKAVNAIGAFSARSVEAQRMAYQVQAAARVEAAAATQQRKADGQRVANLRSIRAELTRQVAAERSARAAALQTARAYQQESRRTGMGFVNPTANAAYTRSMKEARAAATQLAGTQQRLQMVQQQLSSSTSTLTTSTTRYRAAMAAAGAGAVTWGSRLKNLIAIINPLGIAISIGISLLIMWIMRQDEAAAAADRMAKREDYLASVIDFTTGKILVQNEALRENARLKIQQGLQEAADDWFAAKKDLTPKPQSTSSIARFGYLPQGGNQKENAILGDLQAGIIPIVTARKRLLAMKAGDSAFEKLDAFEAATTGMLRQNLGAKIFEGTATRKDYEILGMEFPGDRKDKAGGGVEKEEKKRKKLAGASDEAAKKERELQQVLDRTDKRTDILGRYAEEPKGMVKAAKDIRELNQLVGETMNGLAEITKENPLGAGIYTQEMANADAARINYGVRQPIRDLLKDQERGLDIGRLRLAGYEAEASALEKALSIQDSIGQVTREEYETILANEQAQLRINDALESRGRISGLILGLAQDTRDSFEDMLINIPKKGLGAVKDFGARIFENIARIEARKITEKLFAGTDEKLRELVKGQNGVERAVGLLEKNSTSAGTALGNAATAAENFAQRVNAATSGMSTGGGGAPTTATGLVQASIGGGSGVGLGGAFNRSASTSAGAKGLVGSALGLGLPTMAQILKGGWEHNPQMSANDNYDPNAEIVVTGSRRRPREEEGPLPSGADAYDTVFEGFGDALDGIFKTDGFFKKIGGQVGQAFQGAGTGMMASSFARALGIKQSSTGAAIGGAIGNFLPIPGGAIIGGLIGGTIGGMFKKTKTGSATIGAGEFGGLAVSGTSGNSNSYKEEATGLAGNVINQLGDIAKALGADLTGNLGVSIGKRKKSFVVDTTGRGKTKGAGTQKFDSEEEAIAFAVQNAIQDGVLTGISAASQRILSAGKDLERALEKAVLIESVPKQLMAIKDPVRYAVTELNREFVTLINAMKEGGATAQQYAEAEELYGLRRAAAIEEANARATAAIQAFLDEMVGGSSSPLNKRTVYENATAKLDSFRGDIASGKVVDQNALLEAAQNFQEASRGLFGSGENFFADFNGLRELLTAARDNASGGGSNVDLPGSPFSSDSVVQNAIMSLNGTTQAQTDALTSRLDELIRIAQNDNTFFNSMMGSGGGGSSLRLLPGFGNPLV